MPRLLALFISIHLLLPCYGQKGSVSNTKQNILYIGIPNPLSAVIENVPCDSIFLTTSNGRISGKGCNYTISVNEVGVADISVKRILNSDTVNLGSYPFRVKNIPPPTVMIANRSGGEISAAEMKVQQGVYARFDGFDFDARIEIVSYSFIIHNEQETKSFYNISGPKFTPEIKEALMGLRNGDRIFCYDVKGKRPDGIIQTLNVLMLTII